MSSWLSKARSKLRPLGQLRSWRDVRLFVRILLLAVSVPVLLRLKLASLQALLEPGFMPPAPTQAEIDKLVTCIENVLKVGSPLVRPGCLTRGVTNYYFLKRAGADVTLCFGMGQVGDEFVGHCWLTKQGEPFLEPSDPRQRFTELYSIPQFVSPAVAVRHGE